MQCIEIVRICDLGRTEKKSLIKSSAVTTVIGVTSSVVPQNDKSTNCVKVIGGDELSNLAGKVSLRICVWIKYVNGTVLNNQFIVFFFCRMF